MERAARAAELREQNAETKHRREVDVATAEQTRLERALDSALSEVEALKESLQSAEQARSDAEAAAKYEEHRADRLERDGKKAGEDAAVCPLTASLHSVLLVSARALSSCPLAASAVCRSLRSVGLTVGVARAELLSKRQACGTLPVVRLA